MLKPIAKPKPLKKVKKKISSQQKKAKLRKKATRLLQEVGRKLYEEKGCLVCGGKYCCLHHYVTCGSCSALKFDWNNLIPICNSCHFSHHTKSDPRVHNEINRIKGQEWIDELELKRCNLTVKTNIGYYEKIIETLEALL